MTELIQIDGAPMGLIIMAGGTSRRMGRDKAMLPVGGKTLIEYILFQLEGLFAETYLSVRRPGQLDFIPGTSIPDTRPGQGPLAGLYSALKASRCGKNFVTSCDVPVIRPAFIRKLLEHARYFDIVVASTDGTRPEPLFGVYDKGVLPTVRNILEAGERSLLPLLEKARTRLVVLDGDWYRNLNTRADYEDFLRTL
jgi:molybdopterin-guanine dinucleotide biosynthesis protein A